MENGKSERKKTLSAMPRSKFRQLRRSHAAIDNGDYSVTNSHPASTPSVSALFTPSLCANFCSTTHFTAYFRHLNEKNKVESSHLRSHRPLYTTFSSCDLELLSMTLTFELNRNSVTDESAGQIFPSKGR